MLCSANTLYKKTDNHVKLRGVSRPADQTLGYVLGRQGEVGESRRAAIPPSASSDDESTRCTIGQGL